MHDNNFVLVKVAIMHPFHMVLPNALYRYRVLPRNLYRRDPMTTTISNLQNVTNGTSKNKGTPEMYSAQVPFQWNSFYKTYSKKELAQEL